MAISREEAIELLNTQKPVLGCKEYKKPLMYAYAKAISDMEKLQKIEKLIEYGDSKCEECDIHCGYFDVLDNYCEELYKYDLIEQIVKEVE